MAVSVSPKVRAESVRQQLLAERVCDRLDLSFDDTFRQQFLISKRAGAAPGGFLSYPVGDFYAHHCPSLRSTVLTDSKGARAGLCLGYAVDASGALLKGSFRLPGSVGSPGFLHGAESEICGFAGRYIVLLSIGKDAYAYGDPAGSFPLVYNAKKSVAAASLLMALDRAMVAKRDYDLAAVSGPADPNQLSKDGPRAAASGGFSFGATADRHVRRLTPNFRLCLTDFTETRFWPRPDFEFEAGQLHPADMTAELTERLGTVCNALAGASRSNFALSGGLDSRMLLASAAAQGLDPRMGLHCHVMNRPTNLDAQAASMVAKHFGRDIDIITPPAGPMADFRGQAAQNRAALRHDVSAGFVAPIGDHIKRGALDWLEKDALLLRGNMLELATAVWWPGLHKIGRVDHVMHAVVRCQVSYLTSEQKDHRREAMTQWRDALPACLHDVMHDMNYIENTLPYTQAGLLSVNQSFYVAPACDRRVFELCMGVHYRKRKLRRLYRNIMRHTDPAMLQIPLAQEIGAAERAEKSAA